MHGFILYYLTMIVAFDGLEYGESYRIINVYVSKHNIMYIMCVCVYMCVCIYVCVWLDHFDEGN